MVDRHRVQLLYVATLWIFAVLLGLLVMDMFSATRFFVASFLGVTVVFVTGRLR